LSNYGLLLKFAILALYYDSAWFCFYLFPVKHKNYKHLMSCVFIEQDSVKGCFESPLFKSTHLR